MTFPVRINALQIWNLWISEVVCCIVNRLLDDFNTAIDDESSLLWKAPSILKIRIFNINKKKILIYIIIYKINKWTDIT